MIKKDPTLQLDGARIPLKYFASIEKKFFFAQLYFVDVQFLDKSLKS